MSFGEPQFENPLISPIEKLKALSDKPKEASLEQPSQNIRKEEEPEVEKKYERKEKSSKRLIAAFEAFTKAIVSEIKVEGIDNVREIPPDRKVVIATSHTTDMDLPLVIEVLDKYFDVLITNESLQHKFKSNPVIKLSMKIAGKENFLPIDWEKSGGKKTAKFNPENFKKIAEAMEDGKSAVVTAHNPSHQGNLERGGYGAVYLSEITKALILPVGVNLKSKEKSQVGMSEHLVKTAMERPKAEIKIGQAFGLDPIEGLEQLAEIIDKRKRGEKISEEDLQRFSLIRKELKEKSEIIIDKIAELLPPERQLQKSSNERN